MRLRGRQSDQSSDRSESTTSARGRGWGPFSGGQLAAIIIAVVVVVGFPYAASAVVSGSNVFLTNPTTGKRATVSNLGQISSTVSGTVTALVPAPHFGLSTQLNVTGSWAVLVSGPALVAEVHIDVAAVQVGVSDAVQIGLSTNSCTTVAIVDQAHPAGLGAIQVSYGTGVYIPTGTTMCVRSTDSAHLLAAAFAEFH